MADEPEKAAAPKPTKGRLIPIVVVGLLMLGEGVAVFLLAKTINANPAAALAVEGTKGSTDGEGGTGELAEIEVAECRPSNRMSGKFTTFHVRVVALVAQDDLEKAKALVESHKFRIADAVNVVIRSADPSQINEPNQATLRRRLKSEMDRILRDPDVIKEVFFNQFLQSGPGL